MKKLLCMLLTLVLMVPSVSAMASEVIMISSPDTKDSEYPGTIDDLKIGVGVDMGDRVYMPFDGRVDERYNIGGYPYWVESGDEAEYLLLYLDIINMAPTKQMFLKEAKVVVTYTNSRGDYKFAGFVRQGGSNHDNYRIEQKDFTEIDPLYNGYYLCGCAIPNFVVNSEGRIKMEITVGDTVVTWVYRAN